MVYLLYKIDLLSKGSVFRKRASATSSVINAFAWKHREFMK